MPLSGAAATALDNPIIPTSYFGWLDIDGDPVRATTHLTDVTFAGTGDADLDGFTFESISHEFVKISDTRFGDDGEATLTITLSGLVSIDTDLLNDLGDRALYAGRTVRIWRGIYNESFTTLVGVGDYFWGMMTAIKIVGSPTSQVIEVTAKNMLAVISEPSNRSYMIQSMFDAGDLSAEAAIALANGVTGDPRTANTPVGGGGGGSGSWGSGKRGSWPGLDRY